MKKNILSLVAIGIILTALSFNAETLAVDLSSSQSQLILNQGDKELALWTNSYASRPRAYGWGWDYKGYYDECKYCNNNYSSDYSPDQSYDNYNYTYPYSNPEYNLNYSFR